MILLFIDTTNNKKILVGISINGKKFIEEEVVPAKSAQRVLPLIEGILKKHKLTPSDITAIKVNQGPGSFTGVRVGVAIGNACAFVLGIPINGTLITLGKSSVEPKY